jgi:SAM-dependent methyltransferase
MVRFHPGDQVMRLASLLKGRTAEPFPGSAAYWDQRYRRGGNSGVGSYARFAQFKADIINAFIAEREITSIIEFGCGDGNQLKLARYPQYLGFDVSATAVRICRDLFSSDATKAFKKMEEYTHQRADLTLSLDVIYHLVEDEAFFHHMRTLFSASKRYVILYTSNFDDDSGRHGNHVRHREVSSYIRNSVPGWQIIGHIPNRYPYTGDYTTGSFSEFFIYENR